MAKRPYDPEVESLLLRKLTAEAEAPVDEAAVTASCADPSMLETAKAGYQALIAEEERQTGRKAPDWSTLATEDVRRHVAFATAVLKNFTASVARRFGA